MHSSSQFAYMMLLSWAPICFATMALLRPPMAGATLMLAATMLLPVGIAFDVGSISPLGREELTCIFVLLGGTVRCRDRLIAAAPGRGLELLVLILMAGALATAATNGDSLAYGPVQLPSISLKDGVSEASRDLLKYAFPFFIGRAFCQSARDLRTLFLVMTVAGILYTLPILLELRLSPQLHRWTYGFFQHGFSQSVRYGGYRPMVYMTNGLALTLFVAATCIMSTSLTKARYLEGRRAIVLGIPERIRTPYLLLVLILCKSFASIAYGVAGSAVVASLKPRAIARIALIVALLVTAYPPMRATGAFPVAGLLDAIHSLDEERWHSLEFRFRNEDALLDKARERPAFGWGGFRRARVFDHKGIDRSVTDGYWIIILGERGLLGFACTFGLLVIPVLLAYRRLPSIEAQSDRVLVSSLALVVSIHAMDLLPNGLFSYQPVFLSGALCGVLGEVRKVRGRAQPRHLMQRGGLQRGRAGARRKPTVKRSWRTLGLGIGELRDPQDGHEAAGAFSRRAKDSRTRRTIAGSENEGWIHHARSRVLEDCEVEAV